MNDDEQLGLELYLSYFIFELRLPSRRRADN